MAIQKRNIIRVVILFVFALSAFGFRYSPDRPAKPIESALPPKDYDYVDVVIWRDIYWNSEEFWAYGISPQVPVSLQIAAVTSDFRGFIQVAQAFAYLPVNGAFGFIITTHMGILHRWEISGTFYPSPDCSLVLVIDEYLFPYIGTACGPLVGCVPTFVPASNIPGIVVKVPLNKGYGYGEAGVNSPNASGRIHVAVVNMDLPDETCEVNFYGLP